MERIKCEDAPTVWTFNSLSQTWREGMMSITIRVDSVWGGELSWKCFLSRDVLSWWNCEQPGKYKLWSCGPPESSRLLRTSSEAEIQFLSSHIWRRKWQQELKIWIMWSCHALINQKTKNRDRQHDLKPFLYSYFMILWLYIECLFVICMCACMKNEMCTSCILPHQNNLFYKEQHIFKSSNIMLN